jgi:hypothetical protein
MSSNNQEGDPEIGAPADGAIDLVKFFESLRPEARREYEALAKRDRDFGENVAAERRAAGGTVSGA